MTSTLEFRRLLGNGVDVNLTYQHLLSLMMCNPPRQECWLNNCLECQDVSSLFENISGIFSDLDIDEVTYKQWQSTDRTELATINESRTDFVQSLCSKLTILKTHQFIHSMQSTFYHNLKAELPEGQVLVVGDFSENYSFIIQDAAQGVHWSNSSCTLHPWMCYFVDNGELKTFSVLFISDCLVHDTIAVYAFQTILVPLLKSKTNVSSIQYFSDGCAKQYKNKKNFLNLTFHEEDFGIPAKWSFSATSHGKGPWDGLAGCVKREAALESLRRPSENQILTAHDLYEFAKSKFCEIHIDFIPTDYIEDVAG